MKAMERDAAAAHEFDLLVRRERSGLVAVATSLLGSAEAAEDAVQDALVVLFSRWGEVGSLDRPGAWLRKVVISRVIDEQRRRGRRQRLVGHLQSQPAELNGPEVPELSIELRDALSELPRQHAGAVVLTNVLGYSAEEAGDILGESAGTVRVHAMRGRRELSRRWGFAVLFWPKGVVDWFRLRREVDVSLRRGKVLDPARRPRALFWGRAVTSKANAFFSVGVVVTATVGMTSSQLRGVAAGSDTPPVASSGGWASDRVVDRAAGRSGALPEEASGRG